MYNKYHMMTKPNLSKLLKPFENKWVALSPDYKHVVSSGKTLKNTAEKVKDSERNKVIFHKVVPFGYAPIIYEV